MKIRIHHRTTYRYTQPVSFGQHRIMVRPREGHDVHLESSLLAIYPAHRLHWMRDVNNNSIALVDFIESADRLTVDSDLVLNHYDLNPLDFRLEPEAVHYPFVYDPWTMPELAAFTHTCFPKDTDIVRHWLNQFWQPGHLVETLGLLQQVNLHIKETFHYNRREEPGVQSPAVTLEKNSGSCRDFATLFLEACRCWGLAARFVSGYMLNQAPQADGGSSTHAWTEVYLPGAGWKGFDPTCGTLTSWQHVSVAVSRHPEGAMPILGTFQGPPDSSLGMEVEVAVHQIDQGSPSGTVL